MTELAPKLRLHRYGVKRVGHSRIEQAIRHARFNPDYEDVAEYFDQMGEELGLGSGQSLGHTPTEREQGEEVQSTA